MKTKERLSRLKSLKVERGSGPLFKTEHECMSWIDNIAPLLKYDINHYNDFMSHAEYVRNTTLSADTLMAHLNPMIGIVDQAIIELENDIKPLASSESPSKLWYEGFMGKVIVGVIIGIILIFIAYFIQKYILSASPSQQNEEQASISENKI